MKPASVRCEAIDGILKEGDEVIGEFGSGAAGDAAIIFACQAVEHYEINRYGTMHAWAEELKLKSVANLLKKTLDEEHKADEKLTKLAESGRTRPGSSLRSEGGLSYGLRPAPTRWSGRAHRLGVARHF